MNFRENRFTVPVYLNTPILRRLRSDQVDVFYIIAFVSNITYPSPHVRPV